MRYSSQLIGSIVDELTQFFYVIYFAARYLVVFSRLAMDFRNNPRFSWSCLFLLTTTAQEVQGEANDVNLQRASTQTVVTGSGKEMHTAAAAVDECFDFSFESNIDEQMRPSVRRMDSFTVST